MRLNYLLDLKIHVHFKECEGTNLSIDTKQISKISLLVDLSDSCRKEE